MLKRGLYIHPDGRSAIRSYGYVKNIVHQMTKILEAPSNVVDKKVYYLGDPPISLLDWVNGFSIGITGRPARIVPRALLRALATIGTILNIVGVRFPITLSRYRSMTEDYFSPMDATIMQFGLPQYSLEDGIKETVSWLERYWNTDLPNQ
jgi:nucleoside-diphosphate-sugar epimerase